MPATQSATQASTLDVFSALSNPIRRQILIDLRQGPRSASDISNGFRQLKLKVGIEGHDDPARLRVIRRIVGKGMDVRVDANEGYVRRARAEAAAEGVPCAFHAGDAFAFVPPEPCDGAFNWYTSFGYTEDDRRNARMLRRAFEALNAVNREIEQLIRQSWSRPA